MAEPFDVHDRAIAIRRELQGLTLEERAVVMLDLVGCLAAEACLIVGKEKVAEEIYSLGDTIVGEKRLAR